jgi:hypothetical protein
MGIGKAKEICPDLIVVPYLFEQYQEVSEQVRYRQAVRTGDTDGQGRRESGTDREEEGEARYKWKGPPYTHTPLFPSPCPGPPQMYRILMRRTACVQPLSCDEALMDVTGLGDPEEIARELRSEIEAKTGCTASAGVGGKDEQPVFSRADTHTHTHSHTSSHLLTPAHTHTYTRIHTLSLPHLTQASGPRCWPPGWRHARESPTASSGCVGQRCKTF